MAMITLGNGAAAVFAVMTAVWVFLANALAEFPKVKTAV